MSERQTRIAEFIFYAFLLACVILLFYRFTVLNTTRIQSDNQIYAEDSARQLAENIDERFSADISLINSYAYLLERTVTDGEVSRAALLELETNSPFDALRFTNASGKILSVDGKMTDTSDRLYFREAMAGKSGVCAIIRSRVFNKPVVSFYAPVFYRGKTIGVVHGSYFSDKYLRALLSSTFFGEPCAAYLCVDDGSVVASSVPATFSGALVSSLVNDGVINLNMEKTASLVFKNRKSEVYARAGDNSIDGLCVIKLPSYNFVLVQAFPKAVTERMVANANGAGMQLEGGLLLIFACYATYLILRARRQKKRLEKENREFGAVIRGVKLLFTSRYCVADLRAGTYRYLAGAAPLTPNFPRVGPYRDVIDAYAKDLLGEEQRREFLAFFSLDNIRMELEKRDYVTFECHVKIRGEERWENLTAVCLERDAGTPATMLFLRQNITETKLRELGTLRRLRTMDRKERQYRQAATANAICSFEFNVSQNRLENPVIERRDGREKSLTEEFNLKLPCAASDYFVAIEKDILPESREDFARVSSREFLLGKFASGAKETDVDFWRRDGDDSEICLRQTFYLTRDEESGDIMAMSVVRDITEQVTKQRAQTRALREALQLAQNANKAKTTFLSNMSHDIRTPMNAIIGFVTIASEHLDNRAQVGECLQKALVSSNHLLSLINDILDMSRIESGKMQLNEQACNLSELTHKLLTVIQPQARAKRMSLFIDTRDVVNEDVITDPLKLNQVFINLLGNAVKYTPAGGEINFHITQLPNFRHGYANYSFEVSDNGIGMTPEFVRHIFEPFTRETTATLSGIQGTGLGMAITRNIIEMMNGTIDVESEPNKGSKFIVKFTFPAVDSEEREARIQELIGKRALVVDDDTSVCENAVKMLERLGVRGEWVNSGEEGARLAAEAKNAGDPFDTFILDWQMPGLNGLETAKRIRASGGDGPIIILTAYDWTDIETEAREAGINAFCAKPLFMSDLKNALLAGHNLLQKPERKHPKRDFKGARVLVADDVEMNREIAEYILTENGFVVETAPDGTDAVEMVAKSPEGYYDAILMDVQMPTMNGHEATRAIRNLERKDVKTMPVIAMTANALEEDKAAALKAGMNAHISKPIDVNVFFETLGKFFGQG